MKKFTKSMFMVSLLLAGIINIKAQPANFLPKGIGGGGAQFAPSINPANPNEMYASCDMSPLFHTMDGGQSWDVVPFTFISGNHASHVDFTNDNKIGN